MTTPPMTRRTNKMKLITHSIFIVGIGVVKHLCDERVKCIWHDDRETDSRSQIKCCAGLGLSSDWDTLVANACMQWNSFCPEVWLLARNCSVSLMPNPRVHVGKVSFKWPKESKGPCFYPWLRLPSEFLREKSRACVRKWIEPLLQNFHLVGPLFGRSRTKGWILVKTGWRVDSCCCLTIFIPHTEFLTPILLAPCTKTIKDSVWLSSLP